MKNIILNTDSYKASHFVQYPKGTSRVHSYIEARGSTIEEVNKTTFFGLQYFLLNTLSKKVTHEDIDIAKEIFTLHGEPFNEEGWRYIVNEYGGRLPVRVKALPEGSTVEVGTPLVTLENLDPEVPWLTSYLETSILRAVWYPTTVCTISREAKKIIAKYLKLSGADLEGLPFKLHDFGARGVSSEESAAIGGAAHLVNFLGTDTVGALVLAKEFYGAEMAGFSIPASEHSTITSWGRENEVQAYRNMLKQFGGKDKLLACVSDSYDIYKAITELWGSELQDEVITSGGTLVIRPDSGNPVEVVPQCLKLMATKFGAVPNKRGFNVLSDRVRLIQGDGISLESIPEILQAVIDAGFSTENIAMGMGGALLQHCNRDTFKFAMKCSAIEVDGEWRDVYKDPVHGGKTSKKGRQDTDQMRTVFESGEVLKLDTFNNIRERASL